MCCIEAGKCRFAALDVVEFPEAFDVFQQKFEFCWCVLSDVLKEKCIGAGGGGVVVVGVLPLGSPLSLPMLSQGWGWSVLVVLPLRGTAGGWSCCPVVVVVVVGVGVVVFVGC